MDYLYFDSSKSYADLTPSDKGTVYDASRKSHINIKKLAKGEFGSRLLERVKEMALKNTDTGSYYGPGYTLIEETNHRVFNVSLLIPNLMFGMNYDWIEPLPIPQNFNERLKRSQTMNIMLRGLIWKKAHELYKKGEFSHLWTKP